MAQPLPSMNLRSDGLSSETGGKYSPTSRRFHQIRGHGELQLTPASSGVV